MAPQAPKFNRQIWRKLESEVRKLDSVEIEVNTTLFYLLPETKDLDLDDVRVKLLYN